MGKAAREKGGRSNFSKYFQKYSYIRKRIAYQKMTEFVRAFKLIVSKKEKSYVNNQ